MSSRLCLLLGAALTLRAADVHASLWIEFDRDGGQRLTLTSPRPLDPQSATSALLRASACRPSAFEAERLSIRATINCGKPANPLRVHSAFRLGELAPLLRQAGISGLELILMLPKLGHVDVAPAFLSAASSAPVPLRVDSLPPEVRVGAGFDGSHFATLGAGMAGVLILPWVLRLFPPRDLVQLMAIVQALFFAGWGAWIGILMRSNGWILAERATGWWVAGPLVAAAPPLLAIWTGAGLASTLHESLGVGGPGTTEVYRRSRTLLGAASVSFFLAVAGLLSAGSEPAVLAWTVGGAAVALLLILRGIQAASGSEGRHYKLPADHPLWTRILAIAAKARVPLRGVTILRMRQPAAFALPSATVALSEGLLQRLSRREVDAVVCHELSHLTPSGRVAGAVLYVAVLATAMAAQLSPMAAALPWIPLAIVGGWLAFKAWRRSGERKADLDAVGWCGDPEALITGLARVSNAAGMPLEWGAPAAWAMAHPSTGQRLRSIAAVGAVTNSRLAALLEEACSGTVATDPYPLPAPVESAVASTWMRLQTRLFWFSLLAPAVLGLGAAWILQGAGTWSVLAVGLPGSMLAHYLGYEWLVGQARAGARRLAVAREANSQDAVFAGFSPAPEPRLFEGMYHLDCGLVRFSKTLTFAGENVRFTLDPNHVTRIWIGSGPRHWTPRHVVYVEVSDGRIFSLQSFEAMIWPFTARAARKLFEQLEAWHRQPLSAELQGALDLPTAEGEPEPRVAMSTAWTTAGVYASIGSMASLFLTEDVFAAPVLCAALAVFVLWPRLR